MTSVLEPFREILHPVCSFICGSIDYSFEERKLCERDASWREQEMSSVNSHGLSRYIPADIRREVRRRSKFGCVVCRAGITEFEHIDPSFSEATRHDPENICLLCSSCHDKVTRRHLSKESVTDAYRKVFSADAQDIPPPRDWLDVGEESAKLRVGGFWFGGGAPTILKYFGEPLIEVVPAREGRPFGVNAKFFNSLGQKTLEIEHNVWVGPKNGWDFYISGQRLFIKDSAHLNSLILRVDPPNKLIVDRMDMRIGDYHFLANEKRHAIGHYDLEGKDPIWYYCVALPKSQYEGASVFEIEGSDQLNARLSSLPENRKFMEAKDLVMSEFLGVGSIQHGIIFCANCGFSFQSFARGRHTLVEARSAVFNRSEHMGYILSSGRDPVAYDVQKQAIELPETMEEGKAGSILLDWSAIVHPDLPWPR